MYFENLHIRVILRDLSIAYINGHLIYDRINLLWLCVK